MATLISLYRSFGGADYDAHPSGYQRDYERIYLMKNPNVDSHVPEFYREAGFMAGWYVYTDKCNPNSKYFRYQNVPSDVPHYREERNDSQWNYSFDDERQKRFRELIDAGVISLEVAQYLEFKYLCRRNMFFVGGNDEVRQLLMDAVAYSIPGRYVVRKKEEYRRPLLGSFDASSNWKEVDLRLRSRSDVLLYDGMAPNGHIISALKQYSVHNIVLAGFKEATPFEMSNFKTATSTVQGDQRIENTVNLTIWLGDVNLPDGDVINGVTHIELYERYYNGSDKGIRWRRVNGKLIEIHSQIRY